jgi:hypothetical protein
MYTYTYALVSFLLYINATPCGPATLMLPCKIAALCQVLASFSQHFSPSDMHSDYLFVSVSSTNASAPQFTSRLNPHFSSSATRARKGVSGMEATFRSPDPSFSPSWGDHCVMHSNVNYAFKCIYVLVCTYIQTTDDVVYLQNILTGRDTWILCNWPLLMGLTFIFVHV